MNKNGWTAEEDQTIRDNVGKTAIELNALLPGRTRAAVAWRKSQLGRECTKKSEAFSPEPVTPKARPESEPKQKVEFHKSYVQIESIQATAEAARLKNGTYNEKPTQAMAARANPYDEMTRLRCEVSRLEGIIEGCEVGSGPVGEVNLCLAYPISSPFQVSRISPA